MAKTFNDENARFLIDELLMVANDPGHLQGAIRGARIATIDFPAEGPVRYLQSTGITKSTITFEFADGHEETYEIRVSKVSEAHES